MTYAELHQSLNTVVACYCAETGNPLTSTIEELMQWSRAQVDKEENGETLPFMETEENDRSK